jgi:heme iron utilization protein
MQPVDFDVADLARSLLRRSRQGALATLMPNSGDPYCSLVNVANEASGSPILLISRLALHTKNILADARVSLMLDERAAGDPLEGSRIMLAGRAEETSGDQAAVLRRRYLNAHRSSEAFVNFKDFSFFRILPAAAHLVAGFGRIVDLKPEQFLTDISDAAALLEAEQGAIDHMNADHRDAMNLYGIRGLALHRLRPRWDRHAGRPGHAATGFLTPNCYSCRTAADAEAACRSGPRCSKYLSYNADRPGINQNPRERLGKPGDHQY